jgi:DHA2 family multidrug resistance protein
MPTNPWLIAILVSLATFMEVLDTTIANVALRYISGGLAVGPAEAAWTITSYLVANSVALCASSWLAGALGRRNFFLGCVGLFTLSSILCGLSWSLQSLLFFRVLQGLAGGGMTPVAQSILADAFPAEKRGQGFALYGVAVVVAPIVGPILGGYISDNFSWHWCFLINGPVGAVLFVLIFHFIQESADQRRDGYSRRSGGVRFDVIGFLLVATFLGALEVVLDKGQEDDWFGSTFIVTFAVLSASALVLFVPWALFRQDPVIDVRMLASRQFGACFLVMLGVGGVLIATTQVVPQILQENYGYTATLAGEVLSPGGLVTMAMMFVVGRLSFIQPKYLIALGAAIVAYGMFTMTSLYADSSFWYFADSRMILGFGLPLMFIPITVASYGGLPAGKTDQASSLINLARNFGGSIGVSISQTILAQREQFHQSRLAEAVGDWNPLYYQTLNAAKSYFAAQPNGGDAQQSAFAWIGRTVESQASYLSYIDVFLALSVMAAALAPLALTLRAVDLNRAPQGAP